MQKTVQRGWFRWVFLHHASTSCFIIIIWVSTRCSTSRTRCRDRCWVANRLFHHPQPSDRAVHGKVDGVDNGGQHIPRFVLLRNTQKPQRRPYPICVSRRGSLRHWSGGSWAGPTLLLEGSFQDGGCWCRWWKCEVLQADTCPTTPHTIGDPLSAPHVCYYCLLKLLVVVQRGQMGVSIWDTEWSRCPYSLTQHARDSVAPLRRSSAGWMSVRM